MTTNVRRPLVAGNWKMHGSAQSIAELERMVTGSRSLGDVDFVVCPPATMISRCAAVTAGSHIIIGGQDHHRLALGAHTGDISAEMLKEAGAGAVILGHSERRTDHRETNEQVRQKVLASWRAGLLAIACIGETQAERDGDLTLDVLRFQLAASLPKGATGANLVVAYEPVWAIGTGRTPTPADVADAHRAIRDQLTQRFGSDGDAIRILYGGSVKPTNAGELLRIPNVDGALIGGASLKADDFLGIAAVYA